MVNIAQRSAVLPRTEAFLLFRLGAYLQLHLVAIVNKLRFVHP